MKTMVQLRAKNLDTWKDGEMDMLRDSMRAVGLEFQRVQDLEYLMAYQMEARTEWWKGTG